MCIEIMEAFRKAQLTTQGMLILPDLFFLGQEDFIILFGKNAKLGFYTVSPFPIVFFRGYLENMNRIRTAAGNVSYKSVLSRTCTSWETISFLYRNDDILFIFLKLCPNDISMEDKTHGKKNCCSIHVVIIYLFIISFRR